VVVLDDQYPHGTSLPLRGESRLNGRLRPIQPRLNHGLQGGGRAAGYAAAGEDLG
jgi:hypothetical protein